MENLAIKDSVKVCGVDVPNISGGFGVNKKAMLVKHIAEIHNKEMKFVNQAINNNREKFRDNIDIIDLKNSVDGINSLLEYNIFNRQSVSNAKNIYLLSERGYAKLIKIFNDDKSWELYDQLLDEYFELREEHNNVTPINNAPMSQAEMLVMYAQQFVEQEKRLKEIEYQTMQTNENVVKMKNYLVESPDNKTIEHKVNAYARQHNMSQSDVRNMVYKKIEDKYGIDVYIRVKNRHKKINDERIAQNKKPYAPSTLKSKYNSMDVIAEENLHKEFLEILAGFSK